MRSLQQAAGNRAVSAMLAREPDESDPGFSRDPGEAQKIGSAGEREEIGRVRRELHGKGYGAVYDRHDIALMKRNIAAGKANRPPRVDEWLVDAFPDGRARPELVAIDHKRKRILVLDLTASPSTSAATKPGDVQKLPADAPDADRGKHHLEKTKAYGEQASRRRPPWYSGYKVTAQDRYWTTGKYSVEVPIPTMTAKPSTPAPGGWDPTSGPPRPGSKGPNHFPQPADGRRTPKSPAATPVTPTGAPPGGSARRVIVIDGNIFDQINRGNKAIAAKLLELTRSHDVYIARSAYDEAVTNRAIPRLAKATDLALQELGIKVTPSSAPATLAEIEARNKIGPNMTVLSAEDARLAADAKSIKGEIWSGDRGYRSNAGSVRRTLGVKVAPESETLPLLERTATTKLPEQDYRVGRRLLGLPEVEISISGNVTRPGGGSAPGGGAAAGAGKTGVNIRANVEPQPGRMPVLRGIGRTAGGVGLAVLLSYLVGKLRQRHEERQIREHWKKLQPQVSAAIDARTPDAERLVAQTDGQKVVYAHVYMDREYMLSWDTAEAEDGPRPSFIGLKFVKVEMALENRNEDVDLRILDAEKLSSPTMHIYRFVTSMPVYDPVQAAKDRELAEAQERAADKIIAETRAEIDRARPVATSGRLKLKGSVGEDAANDPDDVRRVAQRLHSLGFLAIPAPDLETLTDAIVDYQIRVLQQRKPDGRVDPGGATLAALAAGRKTISMSLPPAKGGRR